MKDLSIAGYANPAAEWVIAVFMFLFGVNFNLYFFILIRRFREVLRSEELRTYFLIYAAAVTCIVLNTLHMFENLGDCIRTVFFQVSSIMTTTGFVSVDYTLWPAFSKSVLLILMIFGACASSTAGGLKISRCIIIFKNIAREFRRILHPRAVTVTRLDGEPLSDDTCHAASNYFSLYFVLLFSSFLLVSLGGFGIESDLSAVISCINNVGPCFGEVGSFGNYGGYSAFAKLILSATMLIGRLEIIPMVILFSPNTWRAR